MILRIINLKNAKSKQQSETQPKKKKGQARITKFYGYLKLHLETALSTKLDFRDIHLLQPSIGSGTFGVVYRGTWRKVEVAVKVMKSNIVKMEDVIKVFEDVQKVTHCSTGCGGCYQKVLDVISEVLMG